MPIAARPPHASTRPSRLVFVAALSALLAACAPFQRGAPGGTAANPGAAALVAAESRIGAPYRYGGAGPDAFDCSGLVAYAYARAGITLPRTAAQQFAAVDAGAAGGTCARATWCSSA